MITQLVFLILKLAGAINWDWVFVFLPITVLATLIVLFTIASIIITKPIVPRIKRR